MQAQGTTSADLSGLYDEDFFAEEIEGLLEQSPSLKIKIANVEQILDPEFVPEVQ